MTFSYYFSKSKDGYSVEKEVKLTPSKYSIKDFKI